MIEDLQQTMFVVINNSVVHNDVLIFRIISLTHENNTKMCTFSLFPFTIRETE